MQNTPVVIHAHIRNNTVVSGIIKTKLFFVVEEPAPDCDVCKESVGCTLFVDSSTSLVLLKKKLN